MADSWARYANAKLLVLYFASFVGPLSGNTVLALIPTLKKTFNADVGTVLLSITALMIPFAVFQLFSGTMSDVYGRRPILVMGFLIYGIGLTIIGFSPNFNIWVFLAARFICGIGYAFVGPVLPACIGDLTRIEYRGKVMGIYSSMVTFGIAAGPLLAGFFADVWWYIYFMLAGLAFLSMILICFVFGIINIQKKITIPVLSQVFSDLKEVCSIKSVLVLALAGFLGYMGFMSVSAFLSDTLSLPPFYLDPVAIGMVLSVGGAVVIFFAPLSGYLVDRWGRKKVAYLGIAVSVGSLILLFLSEGFWGFMLSMALYGIGGNLFWLPLNTMSVELVPRMRGATASVYNSLAMFGYALAPYLLTPVYEDYGTSVISGFQIIIIIAILIALLMIPFIRYLGKQELPEMRIEKPKTPLTIK
ncbi:MAG: MFS transporter [Candidatus Jordarchaeum sp.]|uniref:MFS transporter n=1 Tax=Candidatus Jordarchaeum sp. TaxID=2823881 RepID=UPI0040499539